MEWVDIRRDDYLLNEELAIKVLQWLVDIFETPLVVLERGKPKRDIDAHYLRRKQPPVIEVTDGSPYVSDVLLCHEFAHHLQHTRAEAKGVYTRPHDAIFEHALKDVLNVWLRYGRKRFVL